MLKKKFSIKDFSEITGLTTNEIEKLNYSFKKKKNREA